MEKDNLKRLKSCDVSRLIEQLEGYISVGVKVYRDLKDLLKGKPERWAEQEKMLAMKERQIQIDLHTKGQMFCSCMNISSYGSTITRLSLLYMSYVFRLKIGKV